MAGGIAWQRWFWWILGGQTNEAEGRLDCAVCRQPAVPCSRMFCSMFVPRDSQNRWPLTGDKSNAGTLDDYALRKTHLLQLVAEDSLGAGGRVSNVQCGAVAAKSSTGALQYVCKVWSGVFLCVPATHAA